MQDSIQTKEENKLITVTRQDLSPGYQTVQTAHSVAEFAHLYPEQFKKWKEESNSIICLSVKNLQDLEKLQNTLKKKSVNFITFYEPDIDEVTSICIEPCEQARKVTSYLPLCNKNNGVIDKHHIPEHKLTKEQVIDKMKQTYQFEKQNVLEHGESVYKYFNKITDTLFGDCTHSDILIPDHIIENKILFCKYLNEYSCGQLKEYMIMHDCGKPYCRTVDEDGKQHFPNHEQVSYDIFKQISDDNEVAQLILHDMDIHYAKPSQIDEFLKLPVKQQIVHLIVGLAELLSNSQMFGGYDSVGFKIKYKNYVKVSKKIIDNIKNKIN